MNVYVYDRYHIREKEKTANSIDEIIARAAVDISDNHAMPIQIEDLDGNILVDSKTLNDLAWDYIESHEGI
jgi:hypothetical protein